MRGMIMKGFRFFTMRRKEIKGGTA